MTSVVGILNKQAIAFAADSAVTIGGINGKKIFNHANKIFTLSKYHPVGIMLYNSADFLGTPWETIIKIYRKSLGKEHFNTLREYQENFIEFLRKKNFYTDDNTTKQHLFGFATNVIRMLLKEVIDVNSDLISTPTEDNKIKILELIFLHTENSINDLKNNLSLCVELLDYELSDFLRYSDVLFNKLLEDEFINNGYTVSKILKEKLQEFIFNFLKINESITNYTGLIFIGFGEEEIYPSLIPLNVSLVIDNKLRYYVDINRIAKIANDNNGAICPFAQTDVIDTILTGIDPTLDNTYQENFESIFSKYNNIILDMIGNSNPELTSVISGLDLEQLAIEYKKKNDETKRVKYISPLMNAVSTLSKEDLAEMAESLIYLTYLKRRITFAEESVGGPVDVAIISKGDGFVWIKRKHYFKPDLNQNFFDKYLN